MDILDLILPFITVPIVMGVYVYLVSSVYPWLCMHILRFYPRGALPRGDRGVRRVRFPEGRGIVCEPHPSVRRYVPRYALFTRDGQKYIRLSVHEKTAYIRCDVVLFNNRGRLIEVLEISERLTSEGTTRPVRLPDRTAYACVIPRQVDGEYTGREVAVGYSLPGALTMAALTVVTTVVVGAFLHGELTYLMTEMTGKDPASLVGTLLVSALLGILCAAWMLLMYYLHTVRKLNG